MAPHSRSRNPEHYLLDEGGRSRHADPYPEHLLTSRGKRGDRYQNYDPAETGRAKSQWEDKERMVRRKERPARPPPPHSPKERDKARDREHNQDRDRELERERYLVKEERRDREQDHRRAREAGRDGERSRESWDRQRQRDRQRQKDRERARTRSRERELEEEPGHSRDRLREGRASWEEERDDGEMERSVRSRHRIQSGPEEVFDEGTGYTREVWDTQQGEGPSRKRCHTHPPDETGTTVSPSQGSEGVFEWCAEVALCCGTLRWWADLTEQWLMKNEFIAKNVLLCSLFQLLLAACFIQQRLITVLKYALCFCFFVCLFFLMNSSMDFVELHFWHSWRVSVLES